MTVVEHAFVSKPLYQIRNTFYFGSELTITGKAFQSFNLQNVYKYFTKYEHLRKLRKKNLPRHQLEGHDNQLEGKKHSSDHCGGPEKSKRIYISGRLTYENSKGITVK